MLKYVSLLLVLMTAYPATANENLVGTWQGDCKGGMMESLNVSEDHLLTFSMIFHWDPSCESESYRYAWQSSYSLDEMEFDEIYPINFELLDILVTPMDAMTAARFNENAYCDLGEWEVRKSKHVAGRKCGGNQLGNVGYLAYNRIQIFEDELFINFNASVPDLQDRPPVDESSVFRRVRATTSERF